MTAIADVVLTIGVLLVIVALIELRWAVHQAAQHANRAADLVRAIREDQESEEV